MEVCPLCGSKCVEPDVCGSCGSLEGLEEEVGENLHEQHGMAVETNPAGNHDEAAINISCYVSAFSPHAGSPNLILSVPVTFY
jgi:hypothetical protein